MMQLEAAKQELEARKLDDCTFAPRINRNNKFLRSYTPLHERLSDLQRRKRQVALPCKKRIFSSHGCLALNIGCPVHSCHAKQMAAPFLAAYCCRAGGKL